MISSALHGDSTSRDESWRDIIPFEDSSHNSATIIVPASDTSEGTTETEKEIFSDQLEDPLEALRELGKSSV